MNATNNTGNPGAMNFADMTILPDSTAIPVPTTINIMESSVPERVSNLPWPNGWLESAGLAPIITPQRISISVEKSENV